MNHDTIRDFATAEDKIDLHFAPFVANDETSFQSWAGNHLVQQGVDTLIAFDAANSIRLVNSANLHANDFILHTS
jgi:hypothetical protein